MNYLAYIKFICNLIKHNEIFKKDMSNNLLAEIRHDNGAMMVLSSPYPNIHFK